MEITGAATGSVLCKKLLLKISEYSQENTFVRVSFLTNLQSLQLYQKRGSNTGVFM